MPSTDPVWCYGAIIPGAIMSCSLDIPFRSGKLFTAVTHHRFMAKLFGIKLHDILQIVIIVIVVMLVYKFLLIVFGMARVIIFVILIYIIYKIVKAIL
jgi:hypothetical protein